MLSVGKPSATFAAAVRVREVAGKMLVTNQEGSWTLLSPDEFRAFARGEVKEGTDLFQRLKDGNFLRDHYDVPRAVERLRARKRFLYSGPNLHIMVVTLRCNETCVYCHASRADMDAVQTDMSPETAEKAVDLILRSTSPSVTIEFQGGEPLVNLPVVKHIVQYAREKNRAAGKQLEFTMVSNLSLMDEEKLAWLV